MGAIAASLLLALLYDVPYGHDSLRERWLRFAIFEMRPSLRR
jgi:hypothetical protein